VRCKIARFNPPHSPSRNIRHYFYRYVEEKLRAAVRIFVTVPNWLKDRLQNTKRGRVKIEAARQTWGLIFIQKGSLGAEHCIGTVYFDFL
jgi:hypothetical protein